jgi:hypothetical protein
LASTRPARGVFVAVLLSAALLTSATTAVSIEPSNLELPPWALEFLEEEGFVVVPGDSPDFADAYGRLAEEGIPAFVTSDAVLHATAAVIDRVLLALETGDLYTRLEELSRELVRLSEEQYLLAVDPVVRETARHNMAYFAVGLSLLDPDYFPSEFVRNLVERELALIEAGTATAMSPILGPTPLDSVVGPGEDYSNYIPRGRYAAGGRADRFYRAATWYGRMAFALPEGRVEDYGLTRQALLIVRALESEAGEWLELWERVEEPLAFFYGDSGDPTVGEYMEISREILGDEFDLELVVDDTLLAAFVERVGETAPAHFETHELRGMRFLGRRHFPETRFLYRLARAGDRLLPTALDVVALLDSRAARSALEDSEDAFDDEVYRRGFEEIEDELRSMTYGDWTRDLHWSWLYALRPLADGPEAGAPHFALGDAWDAKELSTTAAGWALLRHTWPIPGAAALETVAGSDGERSLVEPYPQLYERLRELTENLRDRLLENGLLVQEIAVDLDRHASMLRALERRARAALDDQTPPGAGRGNDPAEGEDAGAPLEPPAGRLTQLAPAGLHVAFSAVAYGDAVTGRVLEVALGDPDLIYVLVRGREGVAVYGGAVFSFYEFKRESSSDVSGSEWLQTVRRGAAERPSWVARFLVE